MQALELYCFTYKDYDLLALLILYKIYSTVQYSTVLSCTHGASARRRRLLIISKFESSF